ncbi:hypothetical protein GO986_01760 [Deinococcus sp. HMF7620]|uniref:Lipoprotein n=2 Tax=Deinococcus arboris TaxID=2682977 RepID=A0A7C9HVT3_9DEIO|nr:hypothetical protein [Deinococcus arboris]
MRALLPSLLAPLLLAACAPTQTASPTGAALPFRVAFSDLGVAWTSGGRACVARAPSFSPVCPTIPRATDVAWQGEDAWAALPGLGVTVTLDRAARTVNVGRVVALSSTRAYREDGSAVTYGGQPAPGVLGAPEAALTSPQGEDFVLLAGRVVRVATQTGSGSAAFLTLTLDSVVGAAQPQVQTPSGTYRLTGQRLERLDATGRVLTSVPHSEARIGVVGAQLVTVTPSGQIRVFGPDLQPR